MRLVELTSLCHMYHSLPSEGGVLAQDPYLMLGMAAVTDAMIRKPPKKVDK